MYSLRMSICLNKHVENERNNYSYEMLEYMYVENEGILPQTSEGSGPYQFVECLESRVIMYFG